MGFFALNTLCYFVSLIQLLPGTVCGRVTFICSEVEMKQMLCKNKKKDNHFPMAPFMCLQLYRSQKNRNGHL